MDLTTTKIVVAVLFGLIRFLFGIFPLKLYNLLRKWEEEDDSNNFINQKRHAQVNCAIALCQSFGGGVLFATCFLHMMTEVFKSVEELKELGNLSTEYPLSQLTICIGFFFVYFLEELSHWIITKIPNEPCQRQRKRFSNFTRTTVTPLDESKDIKSNAFIIEEEFQKEKIVDEKSTQREDVLSLDEDHENIVYDSLSLNSEIARENEKNLELDKEIEEDVEELVETQIKSQQQLMRCILINVALSLHAIFEGIAIGLQHNSANIWYLFIAVSIHSATILFCIGLELLLAKTKIRYIVVQMFVLALASPVGIVLGLLVTIRSNIETKAKSAAIVLLEGLSAGTILYITFFEVLNREKERRVYRLYRAVCILSGFFLMAFLQYIELYH